MRKFICCTMLLASTFSFIGCQEELTNNVLDEKPLTSFTAIPEDINTDTKTTMSYKYDILWNEGDLITITDEDGSWDEFILVAGEGTAKGTFCQNNATECEVWENDVVRAYYPANIAEVDQGFETILTWPSKQTASQSMLMYSEISLGDRQNEQINFKNLGAMMQLVVNSITPDVVLKSIKIQDGTKPLSGTFTIGNKDNAVITASGNAGITLDLGTGTSLGKSAKFFNICVPPGTYSDLTFTFTAMDGAIFVKDVPSLTINRNMVYKLTLSCEFTHEAVQLWEDGPFWATTNIGGGVPEDYGWYFSFANTVGYVYDGTNWVDALTGDVLEGGFSTANYLTTPGYGVSSIDDAHDPAHIIWGGDWRIPTPSEYEDLMDKTTITPVTNYNGTGVRGVLVTGTGNYSGNSIFFPAAGRSDSSNPTKDTNKRDGFYYTSIVSDWTFRTDVRGWILSTFGNYTARSARPVYSPVIPVTGISLDRTSMELKQTYSAQLTATLAPANATGDVIWHSIDPSIATVEQDGTVTGIAPGTATIVATAAGGSVIANCNVTVIPWVRVSSVHFSETSINLVAGQEITLSPVVLPANASDKSVSWTSTNTSVATISQTGKVTAVAKGSSTIKVTTTEGALTASINVSVVDPTITNVSLDGCDFAGFADYSRTLSPAITPANAQEALNWSSSDPYVATVDNTGQVSLVAPGTATITASTYNGEHTASCTVVVFKNSNDEFIQLWDGGPYWATKNVGASSIYDVGEYISRGNIHGYIPCWNSSTQSYEFTNYTFTSSSYTSSSGYEVNDNNIDDKHDAARQRNLGYIPYANDYSTLFSHCLFFWVEDFSGYGVNGVVLTSRENTGNSIFLPARGFGDGTGLNWTDEGFYWIRDIGNNGNVYHKQMRFRKSSINGYYGSFDSLISSFNGQYGMLIRPIAR